MTDVKMVKTIFLRAPTTLVWSYLTEPNLLARWFHEGTEPMKAGEEYSLVRENPVSDDPRMVWGDVLEADPPSRLVYTFKHHGQDPDISATVAWDLEALAHGTKLTMTHTYTGPSEEALWDDLKGTDSGWDEHLSRLRSALY